MTQTIDRLALARKAHEAAKANGFWPTKENGEPAHSPERYLMLIITELSEAFEADCKGHRADREAYQKAIDMNPDCIKTRFEDLIKDSVEDELADAYILCMDFLGERIERLGEEEYHEALEAIAPELIYYEIPLEGVPLEDAIFHVIRMSIGMFMSYYEQVLAMSYLIGDLCASLCIDLMWHVEEKMRYNETRPAKHGKEY